MKLYEVARNTSIKLMEDAEIPPESINVKKGEVLFFSHIDGMYSYCQNKKHQAVHPAAWTEVEVVK